MSIRHRRPILFSCLVPLCAMSARAQDPERAGSAAGEIRGRVVDAAGGRALGSGSVTLKRAGDTTIVAAVAPQADGSFRFAALGFGRYSVRARVLGFTPLIRDDVALSRERPSADLGALSLTAAVAKLEGLNVVAEREDVVLAPDRTSYSTKNMTSASGGTAVDVLRNVPAVDVDGSNRVSLRGNENVVVQINGRPSPLRGERLSQFLAQLPASTIKAVEVATNPSAKNDPEGTAGIINIVLNQDAELGLSGGVSVATGTTGMANLSANIGRQAGPLTLFLSGSAIRDRRGVTGTRSRSNLTTRAPRYVEGLEGGNETPASLGLVVRSEYRLARRDALTFDAFLNGGRFASENRSRYMDLDDSRGLIGLFEQFSEQESRNHSRDYTLGFRRTGGADAASVSTELRYAAIADRDDVEFIGDVAPRERNLGSRHFPTWTFQTDHVQPFGKNAKLEFGLKGTRRSTASDFAAEYLDSLSLQFVPQPSRASALDYREQIGAAYGVLSRQVAKAQAQVGLRLEDASTRLVLPAASRQHDMRYGSAFPSALVSYNLTDMRQLKASYSRRITRPSPFQLSPIELRQDQRTLFRGSPDLRAEYTDAVELSLQETFGWGSLQLNPYLRRTAHAIRGILTVDSAGVTTSTFANVATVSALGSDINATVRRGPVTLVASASAIRYTSDASNLSGDPSARGLILNSRGNLTWKVTQRTDAQLAWIYRAPFVIEGGARRTVAFSALALRHRRWGDQGGITIRVVDPLDILSYDFRLVNEGMVELSRRQFGQRGLFLTVSRSFGQQLKLRARQSEIEAPPSRVPGGP